jgi:hypothetical protein
MGFHDHRPSIVAKKAWMDFHGMSDRRWLPVAGQEHPFPQKDIKGSVSRFGFLRAPHSSAVNSESFVLVCDQHGVLFPVPQQNHSGKLSANRLSPPVLTGP